MPEQITPMLVRGIAGSVIEVLLLATLLLVPADHWYWPRAIVFLTLLGVLLIVSVLVLARYAPASLEARMQLPFDRTQPVADRIASAGLFSSLLGWFAFIPFDVFHFKLFVQPAAMISVPGLMLFLGGFAVIFLSSYQNAFAAPIVRDQQERGHVLVDSGLYGVVRHPLYAGLILFLVGVGLWLQSYASVLLAVVPMCFLVIRIVIEESVLSETLSGYQDYMQRVRYRLLPFIW